MISLTNEERAFWVSLQQVEGLGPKRFYKLLQAFGEPREAWAQPVERLEKVLGKRVAEAMAKQKSKDPWAVMERLEKEGISVVLSEEEDYPINLKNLSDAPPVIYYRGELMEQDRASLAIVGSRTPTVNGVYSAEEIAISLAQQGIVVVSGLARGIDGAAHRGALRGGGRTIAVLGSGLDHIYPPEHRELAEEIAAQGVLISEFPLGMGPVAGNFPARNRIISGLSLGVLVVEAARDSGSLITAGIALEQGREVFAVPGPIQSPLCFGTNRLIKQGAHLFQDVDDVLEQLDFPRLTAGQLAAVREEKLDQSEQRILRCLDEGPRHIDIIVRDSGLAASEVSGHLIVLELKGWVEALNGKIYRRRR